VKSSTIRTASLLDFANAYLDTVKDRFVPKTILEKKLAFRYLFKTIQPTTRTDGLTPAMAMEALRRISLDVSGNAANVARKNLCAAWVWGKKYFGLPAWCPFGEVDKFPADQHPRYVPPEEDFWKVYAVARSADQTMLLLMLHTGARQMEAFRLLWDDVDLAGRKIRLGTRKRAGGGLEYDWIPMTAELHDSLAQHKLHSHSACVFINEFGRPNSARSCLMSKLCRAAGVKPFGFHAIRHLAATILAYDGLDLPSLQAVLRHKNPNTTARYIESLGVRPNKLDGIFEKRKAPKVVPFEAYKNAIGT
jgi:integrase